MSTRINTNVEAFGAQRDQGATGVLVEDVGDGIRRPLADLLGDRLEIRLGTRTEDHVRAFPGRRECDLAAEARADAGHDYGLALQ